MKNKENVDVCVFVYMHSIVGQAENMHGQGNWESAINLALV